MLYKELYKESNELAKERFVLVRERVAEIEEKPETEEKYKEYFRQTAQLLQKQTAVYDLPYCELYCSLVPRSCHRIVSSSLTSLSVSGILLLSFAITGSF